MAGVPEGWSESVANVGGSTRILAMVDPDRIVPSRLRFNAPQGFVRRLSVVSQYLHHFLFLESCYSTVNDE